MFDLDGTLCETSERGYMDAVPLMERITVENQLHRNGHTIRIESARGSETGIDWNDQTRAQLDRWGVKYDDCRTGAKRYGDIYVDDKGEHADDFFDGFGQ